jgi:DNA-binding beta-propeller fold protein YncE
VPFATPIAVCGDGAGGFYVTDAELGEVIHLNAKGRPTGRFGRDLLVRPTGITRDPDSGTIYVADTGNHDIKAFDSEGRLSDVIGRRGTGHGEFNAPTHLSYFDGRLFVADTLNFRVQVLDLEGEHKLSFGRLGLYVGDMTRPKGVTVGRDGRVYVVESYYDHLLIYDEEGRFLMPIGGTGTGLGQFYLPAGVWVDDFGRVYVADMFNGRISVFKELLAKGGGR